METQVQPASTLVLESIQSFGQETAAEAIQPADTRHVEISDNGLDCFCEVFVRPSILAGKLFSAYYVQQMKDQLLFCDGACKKWFHVWCVLCILYFHHHLTHACSNFIGVWGTLRVSQYHFKF